MVKQILSKLPRKSSKTAENCEHGGNHATYSKAYSGSRKSDSIPGPNSASDAGRKSASLKPNGNSAFSSYEALPRLKDVPGSEKPKLFIKKLKLCCVVFDFTDATKNLKEKEIKRQTLSELVDYVASADGKFPETVVKNVVKMVSANLFRCLTPQPHENKVVEALDVEEDEPSMDPACPHFESVCELFFMFVASPETDAKLAKRHIDQSFILKLLDLFDSEDPRERKGLEIILYHIYRKFMVHRPFIRKAINNIFFQFIFETEKHNGIAEFLEILGSIIDGFAVPLKEEHKVFLVCALIPLHKPKCLAMYHQQLSDCIIKFVDKDCKLADIVIRRLLKYWPITNSSKEVMFLNELEGVLEVTQPPEFQRCMVPLFRQIARCLYSMHFQVAERSLFLWNNDHVENLIIQNRKVILPIIFPALEKNARNHWNQAVHSLTSNVRKIFCDLDPELFNECLLKFQEDESKEKAIEARREAIWKRLEELADTKAACSEAVIVPHKAATPASSDSYEGLNILGLDAKQRLGNQDAVAVGLMRNGEDQLGSLSSVGDPETAYSSNAFASHAHLHSESEDTARDNDWTCPKCGNVNFSFRNVCNMRKCNTPKPSSQPAKSDKNSKQKMPEGSWKCEKCNNVNYPFRTKCNRQNCGADKPAETKKSPSPTTNESDQ